MSPTVQPSPGPTSLPSGEPSWQPTSWPTVLPSGQPSQSPSVRPSGSPTNLPSGAPTSEPTAFIGILSDAYFSADGCVVSVFFNTSTDRGGYDGSIFTCSSLFVFTNSKNAKCRWDSDDIVIIEFEGDASLRPGSFVTLMANTVREWCVPSNLCNHGRFAETDRVEIRFPNDPITPVVVVSTSENIGICTNLEIDLSASHGSGCREWFNITVLVTNSSEIAIQSLLNDYAFEKSSVMTIPSSYLKYGVKYDFYVRLCNFLGLCAESTFAVNTADVLIPVLMVFGGNNLYVGVADIIRLEASAFLPSCDQTLDSQVALSYDWRIFSYSRELLPIRSASKRPFVFKAFPHTFTAGNSYYAVVSVIAVTVGSRRQLEVISKIEHTVKLNVVSTNKVTALISGGSEQSAYPHEDIVLDGSSSCDHDYADCSPVLLNFSWSCRNMSSIDDDECNLNETLTTTDDYFLLAASEITVTQVLIISLRVFKEIAGRYVEDEYQVLLRILESDLPIVTISGPSVIVKDEKLIINCAVTAKQGVVTATWRAVQNRLSDVFLGLSNLASSKTTYNFVVTEAVAVLLSPLVLPPDTLLGSSSYTFTLACTLVDGRSVYTSIQVLTLSRPKAGLFRVTPQLGNALSTSFRLSASQWGSDALPLSYQFGIIVAQTVVALNTASTISFYSTTLPAGIESSTYRVNLTLQVYDSNNASSFAWTVVTVNPATNEAEKIELSTRTKEVVTPTNIATISKGIMIVTSLLNNDICRSAPNCGNLHRYPCSTIPNMCGDCLSGFYGDNNNGAGNTVCVAPSSVASYCDNFNYSPSGSTCGDGTQCPAWETCESGTCVRTRKPCLNDCSGHGTCRHYKADSIFTLYSLGECYTGATDCIARCTCDADYIGETCLRTLSEIQPKREFRYRALWLLHNVTMASDIDPGTLLSSARSLFSLSSSVDELSPPSVLVISKILDLIFSEAQKIDFSITLVADEILSVIDAIARALSFDVNSYELLSKYLDVFSYLAMIQADTQENSINKVRATFAVTVGSLVWFAGISNPTDLNIGQGVTLSPPEKKLQCVKTRGPNLVNFSLKAETLFSDTRISFTSIYSSFFEFLNSNAEVSKISFYFGDEIDPIENRRLLLNNSSSIGLDFELKNRDTEIYINQTLQSSFLYSFKTTCGYREKNTYHYTCPVTGFVIQHICNDSAGTMVTRCPNQRTLSFPGCGGWNGTHNVDNGCLVVDFTPFHTTCRCSFSRGANNRRMLQNVDYNPLSSLAVRTSTESTSQLGSIPKTIFLALEHVYDPPSVTELGTSPVLLALFYIIALCMVLFCLQFLLTKTSVLPVDGDTLLTIASSVGDREKAERITTNSMHEWNNFAKAGIYSQLFSAFLDDCYLNHRWLRVLRLDTSGIPQFYFNVNTRNIALLVLHIFTISIACIIICVFVDEDDTYCEQFEEIEDCLLPTRYFVDFERKCRWDPSGLCYASNYTDNPFTILFVSILAHFLIYPVNGIIYLTVKYTCAISSTRIQLIQPSETDESNDVVVVQKRQWLLRCVKRRSFDDALAARITAGVHLDALRVDVQHKLSKISDEFQRVQFQQIWGSGNYSVPPTLRTGVVKYVRSFFNLSDVNIKLSRVFYDDFIRSYTLSRSFEKQINVLRSLTGNLQRNIPLFESMSDLKVIQLLTLDLLPKHEENILKAKFERESTEWIVLERWMIWLACFALVFYFAGAVVGISLFLYSRRMPVLNLWFYTTMICIFSDFAIIQTSVIFVRDTLAIYLIFPALKKVRTSLIYAIMFLDKKGYLPVDMNVDYRSKFQDDAVDERAPDGEMMGAAAESSRPAQETGGEAEKRNIGIIEKSFGVKLDPMEATGNPFFSSVRLAACLKDISSRSVDLVHKFGTHLPRSRVFGILQDDKYYDSECLEIPVYEPFSMKKMFRAGALIFLSSFSRFPIFIQEIFGEMIATLFLFIIYICHLELYRLGPSLVYLPIAFTFGSLFIISACITAHWLYSRYNEHQAQRKVGVVVTDPNSLVDAAKATETAELQQTIVDEISSNGDELLPFMTEQEALAAMTPELAAIVSRVDRMDEDYVSEDNADDAMKLFGLRDIGNGIDDYVEAERKEDILSHNSITEILPLTTLVGDDVRDYVEHSSLDADDSIALPAGMDLASVGDVGPEAIGDMDILSRVKMLEAITLLASTKIPESKAGNEVHDFESFMNTDDLDYFESEHAMRFNLLLSRDPSQASVLSLEHSMDEDMGESGAEGRRASKRESFLQQLDNLIAEVYDADAVTSPTQGIYADSPKVDETISIERVSKFDYGHLDGIAEIVDLNGAASVNNEIMSNMLGKESSLSRSKKPQDLSRIMASDDFFAGALSGDDEMSMVYDDLLLDDDSSLEGETDESQDYILPTSGDSSDMITDDSDEISDQEGANYRDIPYLGREEDYNLLNSLDALFSGTTDKVPTDRTKQKKSGKADGGFSSILGELGDLFTGTKDEVPSDRRGRPERDGVSDDMWNELNDLVANTELDLMTDQTDHDKKISNLSSLPSIGRSSIAAAKGFHALSDMIDETLISNRRKKKRALIAGDFDYAGGTPKNKELDDIKLSHHRHEAGRKTEIQHAKMSARATLVHRLDMKKKIRRQGRRGSKLHAIGEDGDPIVDSAMRHSSLKPHHSRRLSREAVSIVTAPEPIGASEIKRNNPEDAVIDEVKTENDTSPSKGSKSAKESLSQKVIVDHAKTTAMLEEELKHKKGMSQKLLQARRRAKIAARGAGSDESGDENGNRNQRDNPSLSPSFPSLSSPAITANINDIIGENNQEQHIDRLKDEQLDFVRDSSQAEGSDNIVPSEIEVLIAGKDEVVESVVNGGETTNVLKALTESNSILEKIDAVLADTGDSGDTDVIRSYAEYSRKMDHLSRLSENLQDAGDIFDNSEEEEDDGSFRPDYFKRVTIPSPGTEEPDGLSLVSDELSMISYTVHEDSGFAMKSKNNDLVEWGVWSSDSEPDTGEKKGLEGTSFYGSEVSPAVAKPSFIDWGTVDDVTEEVERLRDRALREKYINKEIVWGEFSSDSEMDIEEA